MTVKSKKLVTVISLTLCMAGFVSVSWWLLFRDERALYAIGQFYPHLAETIIGIRVFLLERGLNVLPTMAFGMLVLISFFSYLVSLRLSFSLRNSIIVAVLFQLILLTSYPILSTDIFSYISSNRVHAVYGQNTWRVTPDSLPQDTFSLLADWRDQTKVYGAIEQLVYLPVTKISQGDLLQTVFMYKLIPIIFALGSMFIYCKLASKTTIRHQARVIRTVFWNPLFILEIFGSGHNDIVMIFFLLVSLLFWQRKWWLLAGAMLAASVQVKLIPILFFGYFNLHLIQQKKLKAVVLLTTGFISLHVISFWYMQILPLAFLQRVLHNNSVHWQSLPTLFLRYLPSVQIPFLGIFMLFLVSLSYLQWKKRFDPIKTTALALMGYVLFFSAAYWNWYALWLLVLIPLLTDTWLKRLILLLTASSLFAYLMLWLSYRYGFGNPWWEVSTYLVIFGFPIFIMALRIDKFIAKKFFPLEI